jgi:hypothetical protein
MTIGLKIGVGPGAGVVGIPGDTINTVPGIGSQNYTVARRLSLSS